MANEGYRRKISAILSADVAGYSRLMGDNEAATVSTLEAYKEAISLIIKQHRGRVVDSPGDNLLSEFASVVDAVQCAMEFQQVIKAKNADLPENRKMEFRIGINLGDVIEEGDRIYGDGVNIAARIEGLADPGGICISGSVYDQIASKLALGYENLGEHSVKNIAAPVRVYRIPMESGVGSLADKANVTGDRKWRYVAMILAAVIIIGAGSWIIRDYYLKPSSTSEIAVADKTLVPAEAPSIAVLPFVNMSDDPGNEYFSDGVSEEILNSLVKTNAMPVIARTSSFQYKGKNLNVQKIASELNVTHIMEGSVRKAGNTVRVTAQLVDASTGTHLWSENYDRELTNIFALQDEIAADIVKEIQTRVGGMLPRHESIIRTRTVDEEAYDLYLKAQERFYRYDPSCRESIGLFQQAVEKDPEFADAWVGLAKAYFIEAIPVNAAPLAKSALQRALDIDPNNAVALAWLGRIKAHIEYNWAEGSSLMKRAVRLSPQDAYIRMIYGWYLGHAHQPGWEEEIEKSYRLDPFNFNVVDFYIATIREIGRQRDAERIMESFLVTGGKIDDRFTTRIYISARNIELAEQHLERAKVIWGPDNPGVLKYEYQLAIIRGDDTLANSIEKELLRRMESELVSYWGWGSADSLKRRYQLAYQQRHLTFIYNVLMNKPSQFTDEEWQDLRDKMNIAELGDTALMSSPRSRTKEEESTLFERRIELDPSVIDNYVGVYRSDTNPSILEISRKDSELWVGYPQSGLQGKLIAVSEGKFERLDRKGYQFRFLELGSHEYDLEVTDGQLVEYYRRIDK